MFSQTIFEILFSFAKMSKQFVNLPKMGLKKYFGFLREGPFLLVLRFTQTYPIMILVLISLALTHVTDETLHVVKVICLSRKTSRSISPEPMINPRSTQAYLGEGWNTVSRALFRKRELTEFCGNSVSSA